ncbi:MAG: PhoU domain-containing protein [Myxococcota bacterium]|nr:PhoU domain-containing protein [Myxococcota bacterium]
MMWRELFDVLTSNDPLEPIAQEFHRMLTVTVEMSTLVKPHVFSHDLSLEARSRVYNLDIEVNKLERSIRKRVITHLSLSGSEVEYCLLLMSIVKDAERIGDYIKNISEVSDLGGSPVPDCSIQTELGELIATAHSMLAATPRIVDEDDNDAAVEQLRIGKNVSKRCDRLLGELAKSDFTVSQTTSLVLLTRFHKRVCGHVMNILSSMVMPLHKVDFVDLKEFENGAA